MNALPTQEHKGTTRESVQVPLRPFSLSLHKHVTTLHVVIKTLPGLSFEGLHSLCPLAPIKTVGVEVLPSVHGDGARKTTQACLGCFFDRRVGEGGEVECLFLVPLPRPFLLVPVVILVCACSIKGDNAVGVSVTCRRLLVQSRQSLCCVSSWRCTATMGQFGSKKKDDRSAVPVGRVVRPAPTLSNAQALLSKYAEVIRREGRLPDFFLVHDAPSSEWVDEDGDEAHEFLEERVEGGSRGLRKVLTNLRPKGVEKYSIPRLHPDVPLVIFQIEHKTPV